MHSIGLDVHKNEKTISSCVNDVSGQISQRAQCPRRARIWIAG
jgi:hypothetical protein